MRNCGSRLFFCVETESGQYLVVPGIHWQASLWIDLDHPKLLLLGIHRKVQLKVISGQYKIQAQSTGRLGSLQSFSVHLLLALGVDFGAWKRCKLQFIFAHRSGVGSLILCYPPQIHLLTSETRCVCSTRQLVHFPSRERGNAPSTWVSCQFHWPT